MEKFGVIVEIWSNLGKIIACAKYQLNSPLRRNVNNEFAHGNGDSPWAIIFPWYKKYRENQWQFIFIYISLKCLGKALSTWRRHPGVQILQDGTES